MVTPRQETILNIIVSNYIRSASPIASDQIVGNYDLGVSSATVRNEVGELEEAGFLSRRHTSAGAIPEDKAYRFYVESIMGVEEGHISPRTRASVRKQLIDVEREIDDWANVAAGILAGLVGNMAIATFPRAKESRIRHLELVHLQDLASMLIVVLEQARLRRQIIRLKEPVDLAEMESSSNKVKSEIVGLTRKEIQSKVMNLTPLEESLLEAINSILTEEDRNIYRDSYVDGLRNLLGQPEFAENEKVRALVEGIEGGSLVQAILDETPQGEVVRVVIGRENRDDALQPLSVVICQYGIPDEVVGSVSAVGPTRMEYSKAIAGVKFISSVMSDLVEGVRTG
jgi:heat-inducible transcriptional repressor